MTDQPPIATESSLIYTDVGGTASFNDIGNTPSGGPQQLKRIACKGVFEDKGTEIGAQRFAARFEAERVDDRSAFYRLTSLRSIKQFHVRLEIPLSQQRSVPGHIHLDMIKQLSSVAAVMPKIEVELMLTSTVHPKSERIWVYRPGPAGQHRGYEVPGWTAEISVWGSFPRLDDSPPPLKEL
ncbi:hypothetical protein CKAH01_01236 [Colletotrichum kahawae]|uniref:Uncharacterized protein n=1 Tax=Colletotrichum kahawae TaxID=34407 RepID=A0AAD9YB43_COLKA|nr:hypothetical protein CKAH01_01236 [Colletotrichum kahawae]